ncbi:MAG: hypothetical protein LBI80_05560 [Endomicrobium sp.]|jgi:galactoside O-acetyltransferase|nr:hypothetical protein [Endomicrobium sp.]
MTSFYTEDELRTFGFKKYGKNCLISRKASFYGAENISFGNNVRIDDFCVLSGNITIENYVHVSAWAGMFAGSYRIVMEDFTALSSRSVIYAESDDFSGNNFANSIVPDIARKPLGGDVFVLRYAVIGTSCTVMPGVTIARGVAVGAGCLVFKSLSKEWFRYIGMTSCYAFMPRSKKMLELEKLFNNIK